METFDMEDVLGIQKFFSAARAVAILLTACLGCAISNSLAIALCPGNAGYQQAASSQGDTSDDQPEVTPGNDEQKQKLLLAQLRSEIKQRTTWNQPERVGGHGQCVDCHKQEVRSWLESKHANRAFDLLRTSQSALDYAKKLDIRPIDITRNSLCVNCHGTPEVKVDGRRDIYPGVSCESCHGGSLGQDGWLNIHASYGHAHTLRAQETTEHFLLRKQKCETAGQIRSSNLYAMTKRCFECHVVGDEALAEAGHRHGEGFEMVAKSFGEVRHNFMLDESTNANVSRLWKHSQFQQDERTEAGRIRVVFLVGQMVDLEMSFRGLARATKENDFTDELTGRIEEAYELLAEDFLEEIEAIDEENAEEAAEQAGQDTDDIEIPPRPELQSVQKIVEVVEDAWEQLDDDGFSVQDRETYSEVADKISVIAKRFADNNGNRLSVFDQLDLLPEDFFDGAFDPKSNAAQNGGSQKNE